MLWAEANQMSALDVYAAKRHFFFWKAILRIEPPKQHSTPLRVAGSYPVKFRLRRYSVDRA